MDRRTFIGTLAGGLLAAPLAAEAHRAARVPRMGSLNFGFPPLSAEAFARSPFWQVMTERGWVEGQSIIVERRYAESPDQLQAAAAELVWLNVNVIVANGGLATKAVQNATPSIPIVGWMLPDPVGLGLMTSLSRPSGNVTGQATLTPELSRKRLELLQAALPPITRVAVLGDMDNLALPFYLRETRVAATSLGVDIQVHAVERPEDLDDAFTAMTRARVDALLVLPNPMLFVLRYRVARLATASRVPAIFEFRGYAEAGGLMSYGANVADTMRRAAVMVDKLLRGATPSELPFEHPSKVEFVINLKTAKALGLTMPPSLLQRADQVIE